MVSLGIQIECSEPRHLDALCPRCLLPAMFEVEMHMLSAAGIGTLGLYTACADCGYPEPDEAPQT